MRNHFVIVPIVIVAFVALAGCGGGAAAADPVATDTPEPKTFLSPHDATFDLPLSLTYGPEWDVQAGTNVVNLIYKGEPAAPESEWWGGMIAVVDGALVHDPADAVSDQPATADKGKFVAWPKDLFGYFSSLPGVKVLGVPTPVNIANAVGTQIIIQTPAMHPIFWLKDDSTWLGGGDTGVDPPVKRQMFFLEVDGKQVMIEFHDTVEKYDQHYLLMRELLNTLKFSE